MNKHTTFATTGLGLLVLLGGLFVPAAVVMAQSTTNSTGQALEIAPPVISLTADPGQKLTANISLRDISKGQLLVQSQVNDFGAGTNEDGIPSIVLDQAKTSPYSMKSWVTPLADMTLNPKQLKNLAITINVPVNASPGGYYSAIRFTATAPELKGTGVSLSASLGALIFIRVNGSAVEKLTVLDFYATRDGKSASFFETAPIQFLERIKNSGNLFEEPAGVITIKDMFGKKVATVGVNQPPRNILPDSTRKFEQSLDSTVIGTKMLFGQYKATLKITYGSSNQVLTKDFSFWVIPWRLIGVIVITLIVIVVALFFLIKRYNRFIVNKAQGSGQKHSKRGRK